MKPSDSTIIANPPAEENPFTASMPVENNPFVTSLPPAENPFTNPLLPSIQPRRSIWTTFWGTMTSVMRASMEIIGSTVGMILALVLAVFVVWMLYSLLVLTATVPPPPAGGWLERWLMFGNPTVQKEQKQEPKTDTDAPSPVEPDSVRTTLRPRAPQSEVELNPLNRVIGIDGVPPSAVHSSEPMVEIPLQNAPFKIKQLRGEETENLTLRMYVVVRKKEERAFTRQYERFTRRVLDRVESVLTLSTRAERQETGHTSIKEKSKKAINDELGTPWIQQVLISEYSFTVD
jgi:hypothetical protein